jgi:hypothetical protein
MDKIGGSMPGKRMFLIKPNWPKIFMFLVLLTLIALMLWALFNSFKKNTERSTPDNIARIKETQRNNLEISWTGITQSKRGLPFAFSTIPRDQQLLINTSVQATRLAGYSGPFKNGVFDEDTAVRLALSSGSRCLVIEIDREMHGDDPVLIYRDAGGFKQSLNIGSLTKVAKSIAARAFKPANDSVPPLLANDPLFIVLYFVSAPDPATKPREYVRFLGKVAEKIQPLKDISVGLTPQGDFRRQGLESQLFFQPFNVFAGKAVILCNADTTPFRNLTALGMAGEITPRQDLDLFVHARLYSKQSPSGLGITGVPTNNVSPSAVLTTPDYWLFIPPDRLADAQTQTKKAWTLVMPPVADDTNSIRADQLKTILTQLGVHAVPFCIFDQPAVTDTFTGKTAPYEKNAWSVKPELIRFIPPKPIVLQKPSPQTNANGGFVVSPSL